MDAGGGQKEGGETEKATEACDVSLSVRGRKINNAPSCSAETGENPHLPAFLGIASGYEMQIRSACRRTVDGFDGSPERSACAESVRCSRHEKKTLTSEPKILQLQSEEVCG